MMFSIEEVKEKRKNYETNDRSQELDEPFVKHHLWDESPYLQFIPFFRDMNFALHKTVKPIIL